MGGQAVAVINSLDFNPFGAGFAGLGHSAAVAYALSFGPDFLRDEADEVSSARRLRNRPTTVAQALVSLTDKTWSRLSREVFHCEPKFLDLETVLQMVEETNTCLNLDSPVEVSIDRGAYFTVLVYDRNQL